MRRGLFITFEGGEGAGKTTQLQLLHAHLRERGHGVCATREPGGSARAEHIRALLLANAEDEPWEPMAEALLFQAARIQHVACTVKPALEAGLIVLCDRFLDSTIVYQGGAEGVGAEYIERLHAMTLGNLAPHVTLIFDIDPEAGLARVKKRGNATRFDAMPPDFHANVRQGFLSLAARSPERCRVIAANGTEEEVQANILKALHPFIETA
jgi:dTMP kinase